MVLGVPDLDGLLFFRYTNEMIVNNEVLKEVLYSPLNLVSSQPDTVIKSYDGWYQVINPSFPEADQNEVIICEKELENAPSFFEEIKKAYFDLSLPFKWCWNPFSKPDNLQKVLALNCSKSWEFSGMACHPSEISISIPEGVNAIEVDEKNLDDYLDCMIKGWTIGNRDKIQESCLTHIRSDDQKKFFFLSRFQGEVAGAASFTKYENSCYLGGAVVLPKFRGKGLYKALVKERLKKIKDLKINLTTTQAREATSAPILANLGFTRVFTGNVYQFDFLG